jgi:AcrR family transcriptional regulator
LDRRLDRRQVKTREAILDAFGTLLEEKSYSKITVQNIIDRANVGRSTFYAHFETKDALLKTLCDDLMDHVFREHPPSEATHDFSAMAEDPRTTVTHLLYHLRDSRPYVTRLLLGESRELFLTAFKGDLSDLIGSSRAEGGSTAAIPPELVTGFLADTLTGMVQWWIAGDMAESPEVMAGYYMALTAPAYKKPAAADKRAPGGAGRRQR